MAYKVVYYFVLLLGSMAAQAAFVHPGCLSTQTDLDRMAAKVSAGEQPWTGSWDILVSNTNGFLDDSPAAVSTVCVGSGCTDNYMNLARDAAKAYQCALRYHGSANTAYASKAVQIMNAWASTHTAWNGDSNVKLRSGLYGYQFACAAELLLDYSGWNVSDFSAFKQYMLNVFYPENSDFLIRHNDTCDSHYWANWDLAAMNSMLAIGVLCDREDIFNEALTYFYSGVGSGAIDNAVVYIHPNGLGQWQESGRDQGHSLMGPQSMGVFCEIAWNQGVDLYGYLDNQFLASVEYISKYNTWHNVPFVTYANCDYAIWPNVYRFAQTNISSASRGQLRPGWDLVYNHYVNRMGMSAPYTNQYAELVRPEGGGFNYGSTSGGFDSLGFTTLTHWLDPIADGGVPSFLRPHVKGAQVTLSWRGTPYAESYIVKRSTTSGGPYTTIATVGNKNLYYVDAGLTSGTAYYYVVSANNPVGASAASAEASATADGQLYGTILGTEGSYGDFGLTKELALDGSLKLFVDTYSQSDDAAWVGLDLGAGVSAVITEVKYCPRNGEAGDMVGGKFQGSNSVHFNSGVVDLFTISTAPPVLTLTSKTISNANSFRYVRYLAPPNSNGNVAEVQFLGAVSGLNAPSPANVNASTINGSYINLTWNAVSSATSYNIKRAATSGGPYVVMENVTDTSYTDKDLLDDTTYYYIVSVLNNIGETDSSEISAATRPSGPALIAHCKFDGNATDSSGYGYHASTTGSPSYTTRPSGQAISLDGVDDFVSLPSGVANSHDITIATWVYWNGGGAYQRIFDFGTDTSEYMFLTPNNGSGQMRFGFKTAAEYPNLYASPLSTGVWTHVAVTLSGNTGVLYVNGTPEDTQAIVNNPSDINPYDNFIGLSQWGTSQDPLFNGQIDDFRIYNYGLSALEISALATAAPADTTPPAVPTGLMATLGDGYGSVDLDWDDNLESDLVSYTVYRSTSSGGSYSVLASGLTVSEYTDPTMSNGITYYYVVTASDTTLNESANSNETSATTDAGDFIDFNDYTILSYAGTQDAGTATVEDGGASLHLTGNTWKCIAYPYDITANTVLEFDFQCDVQGEEHAIGMAVDQSQVVDSIRFRLFGSQSEGSQILYYSRWYATTEPGVKHYTIPIGLYYTGSQSYLFFVGDDDASAAQSSVFSNVKIYEYGAPSFTTDLIINLDGIELRDYTGTSLATYADDAEGIETLIFSKDSGPDWLAVLPDGTLTGSPSDQNVGANIFTVRVTDDGGLYDTAQMTIQVTNVYSGTQGMDDLVDLAAQWLMTGCVDFPACNGADLSGDQAVDMADIERLSVNWLADESLQLSMQFDEMAGDITVDNSVYARSGDLINGPTWTSGVSSGALLFDGVDDYVEIPGYKGVTGSASRTCMAWIKTTTVPGEIVTWGNSYSGAKWIVRVNETGALRAEVAGGYIYGTTAIDDGTWHHVAVVLDSDGTPDIDEVLLYVDGKLEATAASLDEPINTAVDQNVTIGAYTIVGSRYFQGLLDDVRIYDRALSEVEIQEIVSLQ